MHAKFRTLACLALGLPLFVPDIAFAAVVFQADFNGSGSGTGGAADIVTFGGTGELWNVNPAHSNVDVSFTSGAPLIAGSGGYMSLNDKGQFDTNNRGAGVTFKPASAENSFDSWYADTSSTLGYDTINGGFNFLFRTNSDANLGTNALRFFDANGGSSGYRLILTSTQTDRINFQLFQGGTLVANAGFGEVNLVAGVTYHVAGTISTDNIGRATVNLYLAPGGTAIDTTSTTHLIASTTTTNPLDAGDALSGAFGSASSFSFGHLQNSAEDIKVLDVDAFRIYNAIPDTFTPLGVIPEPATAGLLLGALALFAGVQSRHR